MNTDSRHKMGEKIILNFFECGKLMFGIVSGIKYTDYGKVLYDVTLYPFKSEPKNKLLKVELKDIDSYYIEKIQEKHEAN